MVYKQIMLVQIYISNYAIIDKLDIALDPNLNVITGETGAGKSIILGALSLILGERADTSVLINTDEKCVVEAHFQTAKNLSFNGLLQHHNLDMESTTIIRREIAANGKSRAFVNDTPVTLTILNELTSCLVDLHRQFDNRAIGENAFQYEVIDAAAEQLELVAKYKSAFKDFVHLKQQFQLGKANLEQWQKEADYNQFLYDELEQAKWQTDEIEQLAVQLKQLEHAGQIQQVLQSTYGLLEEGETPLNNELKRMVQQLQSIDSFLPEANEIAMRLQSSLLELKDIAEEIYKIQEKQNADPERQEVIAQRLDLGYRILKKHGLQTTQELLHLQDTLGKTLAENNNSEQNLQALQQQIEAMESTLLAQANTLLKNRQHAATQFSAKVNELLKLVGMPNAQFAIEVAPHKVGLHSFGADELVFLFDANNSGRFSPLQKVASGGEMSRIMLCIKALTAKALALPTLIFDEVDSGISGEAAKQVGILLRSLGAYHQVICITHQPQVAAKGNQHYFVYKQATPNGKVMTNIRLLSNDERIAAIAQMIDGEHPSEAALQNAKELVG